MFSTFIIYWDRNDELLDYRSFNVFIIIIYICLNFILKLLKGFVYLQVISQVDYFINDNFIVINITKTR